MPSVLARRCPSEHNLILNHFSAVILNVVDRINTAQTNVRITKVAHKGNIVFINNLKTTESIRFLATRSLGKHCSWPDKQKHRSAGPAMEMWGLFDQAKMRMLMAAKIQRPKLLCSVTHEGTQCLWTPGLLGVPGKCFWCDQQTCFVAT